MKIRRFFISFLVFLLVFSNGAFSVAASGQLDTNIREAKENHVKQYQSSKDKNLTLKGAEEDHDPEDEVRVIVEVAGEPALKKATQKGVKFTDLSEAEQMNLQSELLSKQQNVKQQMKKQKVYMKYEQEFATVFNGFSGYVKYKDIEKIEKLSNVEEVWISTEYERPEVTPEMIYSKDIVEAQRTWDRYGYDGKGMIVGVIDTGVDPAHKDFVLSDDEAAALSEADVNQLIVKEDLPGKYYTPKVPYGYNYMDENDEIRDLGPGASMHGMHVSGTVGANGDEDNGGIKGVAPEAQILALKVFGNDPEMGSTWADIYIRAIDDAIALGADVINMSLGSTAAFVLPDSPENQAIENAIEHGIMMSISAGNSAHLGNGFLNPFVANPDIGVVGSPGLSENSLQVASIENSHIDFSALTATIDGEEIIIPFDSQGNVDPEVDGNTYELVYAGLGGEEDFEGVDVTGKYALVQRGEYEFTAKVLNAQAVGAEGVIIYNNEDGMLNMATDDEIVIPQLFMFKSDGDYLAELLEEGETVTIAFKGEEKKVANPTADEMSSFTSWGVTPNLDFKPEITAPGGKILSTLQDDAYGTMSGTSMAAPHVAGGSALMLQRVDEHFGLEGKERVQMAKNILMNTAEAVNDKGALNQSLGIDIPYSPRRQGAGVMKLHAAIKTPVVVTEVETKQAKVALKEVDDLVTFTLSATNFSDEEVTYNLEANIQTDLAIFDLLGNAYLTGEIDKLEAAEVLADVTINQGEHQITLQPGETVNFDVEIDLSEVAVFSYDENTGTFDYLDPEGLFPNGYFIEGFVTLTDPTDHYPTLSVPYVGFKGDWNKPPIFDELDYDNNNSFYEMAGAVYPSDGNYNYLGYDPFSAQRYTEYIAISPGTESEINQIIPLLSYLRNAKEVEYYILDEDGKELRKLKTDRYVRKNYFDGGLNTPYRLDPSLYWDGTVNGKVVEDGQYYLEARAVIDYPGKEAQKLTIPIKVDTVNPEFEASLDGTILSLDAEDDFSGVKYIEIKVNGDSLGVLPPTVDELDLNDFINVDELPGLINVSVIAADYAGNETEVTFEISNDEEGPVIYVDTPDTFSIHSTSDVRITGKVTDASEIVEFTIQDEDVDLTWNEDGGYYTFDTVISFEDGAHPIKIYAKDTFGNESQLANSRTIFVDTTPPILEVGEVPKTVSKDTETFDLTVTVSDNFEELRYYINGNEVFYNDFPGYEMNPYREEVTTELELDYGENVFTLELVDLAGHTTTEQITIHREHLDRLRGDNRFETAVAISQAGWDTSDVVVLARSDDHADALAGVPLAKKYDAPLLLTRTEYLPEETMEEILRLEAKTVYVLGGTLAISDSVVDELSAEGIDVVRINGGSREETAVEIAKEVVKDQAVDTAIIVQRGDFPDALSVAAHAAAEGLPILLTPTNYLHEGTEAALEELEITNTLVIGGTLAISDEVLEQLPNPERISFPGGTRYDTSIAVAEHFDIDTDTYFIATGEEFVDALAGAALAAKEQTGVLLVKDEVTDSLANFITEKQLTSLTIFGGTLAVSEEVAEQLKALVE